MLKEEAQRYSHELRDTYQCSTRTSQECSLGLLIPCLSPTSGVGCFFRCVNIKPCKSQVVHTFSALLDFYTQLLFVFTYFSSPLNCEFLEGIAYILFKFNSQRLVQG